MFGNYAGIGMLTNMIHLKDTIQLALLPESIRLYEVGRGLLKILVPCEGRTATTTDPRPEPKISVSALSRTYNYNIRAIDSRTSSTLLS